MTWFTEVIDECKTEHEAEQSLGSLATQEGFVCGRVLLKGGGKPWRAQAFFPDVDHPEEAASLPEGCHRRLVPESLLKTCSVGTQRG
jgi:hypothetical protein